MTTPLSPIIFCFNYPLFQQVNTTVPIVKITGLQTNQTYRFFVVSRNAAGTSLPSSIVTLNITASGWTGKPVPGAASPPHRLQVESHSATWLQFVWNPPAVSHPEDRLKFRSVSLHCLEGADHFTSIQFAYLALR